MMAELHRSLPRRAGRSTPGQFTLHFPSESFQQENVEVEMGFLLSGDIVETIALTNGQVMTKPRPACRRNDGYHGLCWRRQPFQRLWDPGNLDGAQWLSPGRIGLADLHRAVSPRHPGPGRHRNSAPREKRRRHEGVGPRTDYGGMISPTIEHTYRKGVSDETH